MTKKTYDTKTGDKITNFDDGKRQFEKTTYTPTGTGMKEEKTVYHYGTPDTRERLRDKQKK